MSRKFKFDVPSKKIGIVLPITLYEDWINNFPDDDKSEVIVALLTEYLREQKVLVREYRKRRTEENKYTGTVAKDRLHRSKIIISR